MASLESRITKPKKAEGIWRALDLGLVPTSIFRNVIEFNEMLKRKPKILDYAFIGAFELNRIAIYTATAYYSYHLWNL